MSSRLDEIRARARRMALQEQEEEQAKEEAAAKKRAAKEASSRTRGSGKLDELWASKKTSPNAQTKSAEMSRNTSTQSRTSQGKAKQRDDPEVDDDEDQEMLDEDLVALAGPSEKPKASINVASKLSQATPPSSSTLSEPPSTIGSRATLKRTRSASIHDSDEDDDDDELPDLSKAASSSKVGISSFDEPASRPRRSAARTVPYSYTLKLERPSEARQALLDAKHSAGVKMNIINYEHYKTHSARHQNDFLGQLLKDQKRDERLGITSAGYQHTLDLFKKSGLGAQDDADEHDEGDDSDSALPGLSKGASAEKVKAEERVRAEREKELHFWNRATPIPDGVIGLPNFMGVKKAVSRGDDNFETFRKKIMSQLGQMGGNQAQAAQDAFLAWVVDVSLTASSPFDAQHAYDHLTSQLRSKQVSPAQLLQALRGALLDLGAHKDKVGLPSSQIQKEDVQPSSSGEADTRSRQKRVSEAVLVTQGIRRAERILQITSLIAKSITNGEGDPDESLLALFVLIHFIMIDPRHIQVRPQAVTVIEMMFDTVVANGHTLSTLARRLVAELRPLSPSTQAALLSSLPSHSVGARAVQRTVAARLLLSRNQTQEEIDRDDSSLDVIAWSDLSAIEELLSSQDTHLNPLWHDQRKTCDFDDMEAHTQILTYSLSDLAMQIIELRNDGSQRVTDRHKTAVQSHWQAGLDKLLPKEEASAQGATAKLSELPYGTSRARVAQIKNIARLLQQMNARIVEGMGGMSSSYTNDWHHRSDEVEDVDVAELGLLRPPRTADLSRSRAKTALQRTHLSLLYGLQLLGYHSIDRISAASGQQQLTSFFGPR